MNTQTNTSYIGRYAPSPSGDLHLGNLRTALLAWLHARLQGGQFLMRIEDIDTPRVVPGSDVALLSDLEWLGIDWDGEVTYQSDRTDLYQDTLNELQFNGFTYPCFCSRKEIREMSSAPHMKQGVYPGTCAELTETEVKKLMAVKSPSVRLRVKKDLKEDCGDFILHRADGLFAYQLAVVVDDVEQGVTDVVRGADLSDSTPRQRYLASLLKPNLKPIRYHHAPLYEDERGQRMSKRDGSYSCRDWRDEGRDAAELVSMLAQSLGLIDCLDSLTAADLLSHVDSSELERCFVD